MDASQRRTLSLAAFAVAVVLFVFFFGRAFWEWASWSEAKGTLDFGLFKVSSRPPFPNDARSVLLGLVAPIVLVAWGRVVAARRPDGA
jgi:hypothetical protein